MTDTIRAALRVLQWAWTEASGGNDIDGGILEDKMRAEGLLEKAVATEDDIKNNDNPGWEYMQPGDIYYRLTPALAAVEAADA
jgi:hypothetical protein